MLSRIKLLQIGDIHFPDLERQAAFVDHKDKGIPLSLLDPIVADVPQQLIKSILKLLDEDSDICGLIFCGDFTTRGNIEAYRNCMAFLQDSLQINVPSRWPNESLHVVPGNHDVDQAHTHPDNDNIFDKFQAIVDIWNECRPDFLPASQYRHTTLQRHVDCMADIYSLNSCIGCGSWRKYIFPSDLPEETKAILNELILKEKSGSHIEYQRLDTPAFLHADVESIVASIRTSNEHSLPVIVSHHNLLPQALPRIALYTDLLNGGVLRNQLLDCRKPVLYLHGHIHDDPIETITTWASAANDNPMIACISCPEFKVGFNLIHIVYSTRNIPLGCIIRGYRVTRAGDIMSNESSPHIRFYNLRRALTQHCLGNLAPQVLQVIQSARPTILRFQEIAAQINIDGHRYPHETIATSIEELFWTGSVDIDNKHNDFRHWIVRGGDL